MNSRFFIMLIVALILAAGAAWVAKDLLYKSLEEGKQAQGVVPIIAAAIDIPYAAKIEPSQIKLLAWPKDHVPKGALTDPSQAIGKIAQRAFVTDEALLEPQVKDKIAGSILSALIPNGKRAMSLPVNAVSGVAGFITPGNMVDIIATNGKNNRTYILLSNIKVLAIDQVASTQQDKPAVVRALTLEVSTEESTVLVKAMRDGPLYFTLRNPADKQNVAESSPNEMPLPDSAVEKENKNWSVKPTYTAQPAKPRLTIVDWPTGKKQSEEPR